MQEEWLAELQTDDILVRQRIIVEMANSHDPDALKLLKFLYEHDPDETNRGMAKNAALHLWHSLQSPQTDSTKPDAHTGAETLAKPVNSQISEFQPDAEPVLKPLDNQSEKARIYLDRALASLVKEDTIGAQKALMQAITLNPFLQEDQIAVNLASELTGLAPSEAMEALRRKNYPFPTPTSKGIKPPEPNQPKPQNGLVLILAAVGIVILGVILFILYGTLQSMGLFGYQQQKHDLSGYEYYLILPKGKAPEAGWPAVVAFHGYGGMAEDMLPLAHQFTSQGIVFIAPTLGEYQPNPGNGPINPVEEILSQITKDVPLRTRGVFLLGLSQGGSFAYRYSVLKPEWIGGVVTAGAPELEARPPINKTLPYIFTWGSEDNLKDFVVPASVTPLVSQGYNVKVQIIPNAGHVLTAEAISLAIQMASAQTP
jgi:predicted esterase